MKPLLALTVSLVLAGAGFAFQETKGKAIGAKASKTAKITEDVIADQLPSYPFDKCIVSDEPLDAMGEPLNFVHEGRLVRLCCKSCTRMLKKDPASFLAMIDEAVIKEQKASYPLKTCPVSGEELGTMGDPIDYVHGTRLVRFCCKGCVKGFNKSPEKYMATIDEGLIKAQLASYPLKTCIVSGEPLDAMGEPHNALYGTRLVRFCCKKCPKAFRAEPDKYLAKLGGTKKQTM